jgi:hypothetical protein
MPSDIETLQITSVDGSGMNLIATIQALAEYTRDMLKEGQLKIAERCFKAIDKLYTNGDQNLKDMIISYYLYALTITISYSHCENIIPVNLKEELFKLDKILINNRNENIDEQ